MDETLQSVAAETGAQDPEYQAYLERNHETEMMKPLSYDEWRSYQPTATAEAPPDETAAGDVPETISANTSDPAGNNSNSVGTLPGANVNYENGHQVIITNNPTFTNSPNFNEGGNQVVGSGEISSPVTDSAQGEAPRRIPVTESPDTRPAEGEQRPPARSQEVEELRQQLDELRGQLGQEREQRRRDNEERNRQHDEQMQAIRDISESIRQQNENITRLLEFLTNQRVANEPQPEPRPEPTPEPGPNPVPTQPEPGGDNEGGGGGPEPQPETEPELEPELELEQEEETQEYPQRTLERPTLRERMRRGWDRVGEIVSWPWNRAYNWVIIESVGERQRRRRMAGFLGSGIILGVLLAGAADLVEDALEAKHGVPKTGIGRTLRENHSEHMAFFGPGHRTGAELPSHLHFGHDASGHEVILDRNNNVVVGHEQLPHGIAQTDGVLSKDAEKALRRAGESVTYHRIDSDKSTPLYMSEVS